MTEHQRETAFLRRIIRHDDSDECRKLDRSIDQVQRDERCVARVAAVTALFPLLGIAGVAYGAILLEDFPSKGAELVSWVLCAVGLASLICLVAFVGLLMVYRKKLNQLRQECRQLVTRLLESHLGKAHTATSPASHPVSDDREAFQGAAEPDPSQ